MINSNNNIDFFLMPALVTGATFATSRVVARILGESTKKVADCVNCETLKNLGDNLTAFATRDSQTEFRIVFGLAGFGTSIFWTTSMLSNELQAVVSSHLLYNNATQCEALTSPQTLSEQMILAKDNIAVDPTLITNAPLGTIIVTSLGSRVMTGVLGTCAKVTSIAVNLIGFEDLGQKINETGNNLLNYATKNPFFEIGVAGKIKFYRYMYSKIVG